MVTFCPLSDELDDIAAKPRPKADNKKTAKAARPSHFLVLPVCVLSCGLPLKCWVIRSKIIAKITRARSEEHTSELQSRQYLVCRLLLEKKKKHQIQTKISNIKR